MKVFPKRGFFQSYFSEVGYDDRFIIGRFLGFRDSCMMVRFLDRMNRGSLYNLFSKTLSTKAVSWIKGD